MRYRTIVIIMFIGLATNLSAQADRKFNRKAMKALEDGKYNEAILNYQKALKANPEQAEYHNNLGHAHYRNENYELAAEDYLKFTDKPGVTKSEQFHNLGNAFLQAGDYDKSIQSYIEALKLDSESDDTKYNLSMAQAMLRQQQQQQQQQNQDQNKNQNKEQEQQKQNQDQDQEQEQEQEQQQDQQQQQQKELSKEDAERMLEALQKREEELQEDNKKKAKVHSRQPEKDW